MAQKEGTMTEHILIATDGSDLAQRGLDKGLSLAKGLGAKVTIMTVTPGFPTPYDMRGMGAIVNADSLAHYDETQKANAEVLLTAARQKAAAAGVEAVTLHVPDAHPAEAILTAARDHKATMVVMASHGRRGLGRILLGSQTSEVLSQSEVPVLVVR
jgi:nucleotide-binding universal stress UspA family protein